ncbi:cytochrome P450 [Fistulina hepatica ATCC 64428]|uniref:Cytochrome P450 n=1 Tax=Fistulina hepatica ATCC 64428 TaxID=1128425 RepID=A0A0D7A336_9AGAR|nr:cytochrome P450 [Fistulina hepatica ATCC 64428]
MFWCSHIFALSLLLFISLRVLKYVAHCLTVHFTLRSIPRIPASSLLWGEEWNIYNSAPGAPQLAWHRRLGHVHQIVSITDPRAVTFIISERIYDFPKPYGVRAWFKATLGEGILWTEGRDAHEYQRRIIAPGLSQSSVRMMVPIFYETAAKLAAGWCKILDASPSEYAEIEVTDWAARFALDTVGRAAFSHDFDCLAGGPHRLAETLDGLTNNEHKRSSFYMRALFWIFPSILNIGAKGQMIRQSKQELGAIASRMWHDAKVAGDAEARTLMAQMMRASMDSGRPMHEEEVRSHMRTVISAGFEPVSAIVAWMIYEIAANQRLQDALRDEIIDAGDPSFDELRTKFPLLDATLMETLRLHPAILENHHETAETVVVPLSEPLSDGQTHVVIPKGTTVSIPLNVLQSDPAVFGTDAHLFRAERWLERKARGVRHAREIFAFSEGPRSCLGKAFAIAEIKVLLITLLRQFSFSCEHDIEPFQSFVIRPRIRGQQRSSLPIAVKRL